MNKVTALSAARMSVKVVPCPRCGAKGLKPCSGERLISGALVGVSGGVDPLFTDFHAERFEAAVKRYPGVLRAYDINSPLYVNRH